MIKPQPLQQVSGDALINSNVLLLLHMNGVSGTTQFIDSSNYNRIITPSGATKLSATKYRYGGTSAVFDGTTDYLTIAASTDFNVGAGNWCLSFWVNPTAQTAYDTWFMRKINDVNYASFQFDMGATADHPRFIAVNAAGSTIASYSTTDAYTFTNGTWYHVYWSRVGTTIALYINGTAVSLTETTAISTTAIADSTLGPVIGYDVLNASRDINAYIDEFMFVSGTVLDPVVLYNYGRPYGYPYGGM